MSLRRIILASSLILIAIALTLARWPAKAQEDGEGPFLVGVVYDQQGQPIAGASVALLASAGTSEALAETTTQADGRYALPLPSTLPADALLSIQRAHFEVATLQITPQRIQELPPGEAIIMPDVTMQRMISPAFWVATLLFIGVLVLIATGVLHNTLAALLGAASVLAISYIGGAFNEGLFIFDFAGALKYIDWNVIFLIMGMMIIIAVIENTGIFQWLAFFSFRISGGRAWLLLPILMLITGIASAFLDNVTTMLLVAPMSIQIAIALGVNPLALLIPEVMASNVIGVSTLVGTPTNILIGSYAKITFNNFLTNLTPGVLLAFLGLLAYSYFIYRKELASSHTPSEALIEQMAEGAKITHPIHLRKCAAVFALMLVMFVLGEKIHLLPAVTALVGAALLLIWVRPDIEEMIEAVDWTTLVFFISLFILVGAIQEVGLISAIASLVGRFVGQSLLLAILAVIWLGALLSTVVANIPFTAAMLPIVGFLSRTVPGAQGKALFYCLSIGSGMGGNGSLIGASANMVTVGISKAAGYPISFAYFLKKGLPALAVTVGLATLWLLVRFH
jgi:Na+/H+ antiporter NhaD/arsenite permease-like protein